VRLAVTGKPPYFNVGYETYPDDTRVQTFAPRRAAVLSTARSTVALLSRAGSDPGILPAGASRSGETTLAPGQRAGLADIRHPGAIRAITVRVNPHDDSALHNVWLEARWDGSAVPAVSAPLADLFLSGAGERSPARGLLAGYDPTRHQGYLYFPMPFARSARVQLVNRGTSSIAASWLVQQATVGYSRVGTEVGEFHATFNQDPSTKLGSDYVMLSARGQGKVAGVSYTEEGPYNQYATVFMEGDERVYIDRSSTPRSTAPAPRTSSMAATTTTRTGRSRFQATG
jgi:hypothetical protein